MCHILPKMNKDILLFLILFLTSQIPCWTGVRRIHIITKTNYEQIPQIKCRHPIFTMTETYFILCKLPLWTTFHGVISPSNRTCCPESPRALCFVCFSGRSSTFLPNFSIYYWYIAPFVLVVILCLHYKLLTIQITGF